MNKGSNEDLNKPTKKKRKRVKIKTTNQENIIETNDNEISTNEVCTQQINKQEEKINTKDERNDEMNRKRKLQCQKGRELESPVGESNKESEDEIKQKNQTNKDDSTHSDNQREPNNKQDDNNPEKEDEKTDLYCKLKLVERYKYKLK